MLIASFNMNEAERILKKISIARLFFLFQDSFILLENITIPLLQPLSIQ